MSRTVQAISRMRFLPHLLWRECVALPRCAGTRRLLVLTVLTAALVGVGYFARGMIVHRTAAYWSRCLVDASDSDAARIIRALEQTDDVGIPYLVEAMASPRENVARAAEEALRRGFRSWQSLESDQYSRRACMLLEALAGHVEHFSPTSRSAAADLTRQILRLPLDERAANRAAALRASQTILSHTTIQRRESVDRGRMPPVDGPTLGDARSGAPRYEEFAADNPVRLAASPYDQTNIGYPAESSVDRPLVQPGAGLEYVARHEPLLAAALDTPPRWHLDGDESSNGHDAPPRASATDLPDSPTSPAIDEFLPWDPTTASIPDLMRKLAHPDRAAALEAETVLRARGFRENHLLLARQWADPNPAVRGEVATAVFQLSDVAPAWWLELLVADQDASVRRAAVSAMGSSGNPEWARRAHELALQDTDPRVRDLADRLGQRVAADPSRARH